MNYKALIINKDDNVAVALDNLSADDLVDIRCGEDVLYYKVIEAIPKYHKFAIMSIPARQKVIKYGETIGEATQNIPIGAHVHVHNVRSLRGYTES
ncbi:UxaA family hydrolase [Mahella australiensis]|uniref:SAF domain protein n=1 Tax=Mahella australiensis (strain DSM 15567 / CIP 107919 / 50-1 BON) TaxID=697281 RepID=F4A0R3_MAHA5|nr:UxaA family hydrolase [Mahella australiensis]AEE96959.1 SAF domain protein [Mahella australiensis 50-1 BON]